MLTIGEYLAPTGRKVWIEDVVVDEAMRGRSLGRMLVEHAITYSKTTGGGTLMLTSRPSRIAANRLYRSCGFEPKETNMYRMSLDAE
jgi:ribosomal protein S18 acetylase RimI-like enzyme